MARGNDSPNKQNILTIENKANNAYIEKKGLQMRKTEKRKIQFYLSGLMQPLSICLLVDSPP